MMFGCNKCTLSPCPPQCPDYTDTRQAVGICSVCGCEVLTGDELFRIGASADRNIENAGYILYAFLGGQARREITNNPQTPKAWENAEVMESSTHEPRRYALGRL